jgi:dTDP-4-amino-4,6-dideoxygalactose transaminase
MSEVRKISRQEVPILVPKVPKYSEYLHYLEEIDSNNIFSNFGPLNSRLIANLVSYMGLESWQIQTVANATLGIEGAIATANISLTHKWAMPSWTFTATAAACSRSGIDFQFVDIENSWRADLDGHFAGLVDVLPFGDDLNFKRPYFDDLDCIIVDAAASFDSLKDIKIPDHIPIAILISLHATKCLPAGEGGVFITNREEWADRFKSWSNFGMSENRISNLLGTNAKMSEINSAIALASLDKWEDTKTEIQVRNSKAMAIISKYNLSTTSALEKNYATPYWIVKFKDSNQKNKIRLAFKQNSISTRDWWSSGCHNMPAYRNVPYKSLSKTDHAYEISLGLPFHHKLTEDYWTDVDSILSSYLN